MISFLQAPVQGLHQAAHFLHEEIKQGIFSPWEEMPPNARSHFTFKASLLHVAAKGVQLSLIFSVYIVHLQYLSASYAAAGTALLCVATASYAAHHLMVTLRVLEFAAALDLFFSHTFQKPTLLAHTELCKKISHHFKAQCMAYKVIALISLTILGGQSGFMVGVGFCTVFPLQALGFRIIYKKLLNRAKEDLKTQQSRMRENQVNQPSSQPTPAQRLKELGKGLKSLEKTPWEFSRPPKDLQITPIDLHEFKDVPDLFSTVATLINNKEGVRLITGNLLSEKEIYQLQKKNTFMQIESDNRRFETVHALFASGEGADLTFSIDGKTLHAHRFIFAAFSESAIGSIGQGQTVTLTGIEATAFKEILETIYLGTLTPANLEVLKKISSPSPANLFAGTYQADYLTSLFSNRKNKENIGTDCTIKVGDDLYYLHQALLKQLPFFKTCLEGNMVESQTKSITLELEKPLGEAFLKYFYSHEWTYANCDTKAFEQLRLYISDPKESRIKRLIEMAVADSLIKDLHSSKDRTSHCLFESMNSYFDENFGILGEKINYTFMDLYGIGFALEENGPQQKIKYQMIVFQDKKTVDVENFPSFDTITAIIFSSDVELALDTVKKYGNYAQKYFNTFGKALNVVDHSCKIDKTLFPNANLFVEVAYHKDFSGPPEKQLWLRT